MEKLKLDNISSSFNNTATASLSPRTSYNPISPRNTLISPRNIKKIKIRFDIELIKLERIPKNLENEELIISWRKKAVQSYLSKKDTGRTDLIPLTAPITLFHHQYNTSFGFSTSLFVF